MATAILPLGAPQAPLVDLVFSVLVGGAQIVVGWLLCVHGMRPASAQRVVLYALGLLGIWLIGSGVAEVCVSGLLLWTRVFAQAASGVSGPAQQVRQIADTALLYLTVALVCALPLYPLWRRIRHRPGQQQRNDRDRSATAAALSPARRMEYSKEDEKRARPGSCLLTFTQTSRATQRPGAGGIP